MAVPISKNYGIKCFKRLERSHFKHDAEYPSAEIAMHSLSATKVRVTSSTKLLRMLPNHWNIPGCCWELHVTWSITTVSEPHSCKFLPVSKVHGFNSIRMFNPSKLSTSEFPKLVLMHFGLAHQTGNSQFSASKRWQNIFSHSDCLVQM